MWQIPLTRVTYDTSHQWTCFVLQKSPMLFCLSVTTQQVRNRFLIKSQPKHRCQADVCSGITQTQITWTHKYECSPQGMIFVWSAGSFPEEVLQVGQCPSTSAEWDKEPVQTDLWSVFPYFECHTKPCKTVTAGFNSWIFKKNYDLNTTNRNRCAIIITTIWRNSVQRPSE